MQLGVIILLAAMVGGIGLPAFIIHPVSIWFYIAARRAAADPNGSSGKSDAAMVPTVVNKNASSLVCTCKARSRTFLQRRRSFSVASLLQSVQSA